MRKHARFADGAGYTRHCWECIHAEHWKRDDFGRWMADCPVLDKHVEQFDSPNNGSSKAAECMDYDDGKGATA